MLSTGQEKSVQRPNSLIRESYSTGNKSSACSQGKAPKSRAEPITKRVKLVEGNCAGKLFNDCVPTDDLEQLDFASKADAIDDSGSTMNGCVVTPVYENSTGKRVLDNSSQTVYSKFKLSAKVETMILKNEEFFKRPI